MNVSNLILQTYIFDKRSPLLNSWLSSEKAFVTFTITPTQQYIRQQQQHSHQPSRRHQYSMEKKYIDTDGEKNNRKKWCVQIG